MKLKEKFENIIYNYVGSEYDRRDVSNILEKETDVFAIEFAEWIANGYSFADDVGLTTTKELLEIYKRENKL